MKDLTIICDGDSWVFGCEVVDPKIAARYDKTVHPGAYDYLEENDAYRIPKIFPTILGELLDADVVNLSWPADDNGTILNRTITYLTSNYIEKGLSTDNLLVIVGWSSPERNFFWYKDDELSSKFRLWPNHTHFDRPPQKDFWELYVTYLWNKEEFLPRYVMNNLLLQNFCMAHNIKWLTFSSFYQMPKSQPTQWVDLKIAEELKKLNLHATCYHSSAEQQRKVYKYEYLSLWNTIDPIRYYNKNEKVNTFKTFMERHNVINPYNGWHPSPESHKLWAEELYRYITQNNLHG